MTAAPTSAARAPATNPALDGPVADAERSVLAACMLGSEAIGRARALVKPSDFCLVANGKVFAAIAAIHGRGEAADFVTVAEELRRRGDLDAVGGQAMLVGIAMMATTTANLEAHCRIVTAHAGNRTARRTVLELYRDIEQDPDRALELLVARRERIGAQVADAPAGGVPVEYLDLAAIGGSAIPAVPWLVPGWLAAEDIALASGDGGIGKSTTIAALAVAVATGGAWCGIPVATTGPVLVFDEEQSVREVSRLYLRLGAPHDGLHVASQQGINLATAAGVARVEREMRTHQPVLVVLDSVQQVFAGVDGNDAAEVSRVYAELFRLRREHGAAFVLIGHLRKPSADGHTAKLHLVHGSVAFATQASTVWVASQPARGLMDLVQVKRRDGERASLRVRYLSEGPDAPIVLTGEGPIEDAETITEKAEDFVVGYLARHGASPTKWIVAAAAAEVPPLAERSVHRALARLAGKLGTIERPRRGYYTLAAKPGPPEEQAT